VQRTLTRLAENFGYPSTLRLLSAANTLAEHSMYAETQRMMRRHF
jgi:hypothetical protein